MHLFFFAVAHIHGMLDCRQGRLFLLQHFKSCACAGEFLSDMVQLAPEVLQKGGRSIGKHADMWATGLLATRLLTTYFPFDDIIGAACCSRL